MKRKDTRVSSDAPLDAAQLAERLNQSEDTLRAIQNYLVDAFIVKRGEQHEVVTLDQANYPYRNMVESMNEGAVTLIPDGTLFYANPRFSEMVGMETADLIGTSFRSLLAAGEQQAFDVLLYEAGQEGRRAEYSLRGARGASIPVQLSVFLMAGTQGVSILVTDVSERHAAEEKIRALATRLARAEQDERLRISQVLHDDLLQRLFALKAQVCLIQDAVRVQEGSNELTAELGYMDEWITQTINITRDLSIDLMPAVLQSEGLVEAINWLASHIKKSGELQIDVRAETGFPRLDSAMQTLLFQAVRELLFGVVRESGVRECSVVLEQTKRQARIALHCDGQEFDAGPPMKDPAERYGLTLVRDRLGIMGCTLKITTKPGKGLRAIIAIPLGRRSVQP